MSFTETGLSYQPGIVNIHGSAHGSWVLPNLSPAEVAVARFDVIDCKHIETAMHIVRGNKPLRYANVAGLEKHNSKTNKYTQVLAHRVQQHKGADHNRNSAFMRVDWRTRG